MPLDVEVQIRTLVWYLGVDNSFESCYQSLEQTVNTASQHEHSTEVKHLDGRLVPACVKDHERSSW